MMVVRCGVAALCLGSVFMASGQTLRYASEGVTWANTITAEDLSGLLHVLAADSMEGRETGKEGQRKAAAFIAEHFESLGLEPVQGSYFQNVPLKTSALKGGVIDFKGSKQLYRDSWVPYPGIEVSNIEGEAVFVGFGVQDEELGLDDYAGVEVEGSIVFMMSDVAEGMNGKGRRELADSLGASAVVMVVEDFATTRSRMVPWLERERMTLDVDRVGEGTDIPTLLMSAETVLGLTGWKSIEFIEKKWPKRKLKGLNLGPFTMNLARMDDRIEATNVWGFLPGADSTLSQEIVVLTSHYDHVGVDKEGLVYNGADDDGSGTVSLLENAAAWMAAVDSGMAPKRSILFMAFVGEEKGLLGSEWYSDNPAFPLEAHVCDLNMDMVGRFDEAHADNDRYVYLIGGDKLSTELHEISEAVNEQHIGLSLDYTFNAPDDPNRFYYRSDHYNFAKHNIPVIFYFSGVHEDYHGPGDTPDKVRYPKMAEIGRLVFLTSWEVANRASKLTVDKVNDFPANRR